MVGARAGPKRRGDHPTRRIALISETRRELLGLAFRGDRNLDGHRLKCIAFADNAADHRHHLTNVASDADRDEIGAAKTGARPCRRQRASDIGDDALLASGLRLFQQRPVVLLVAALLAGGFLGWEK